MIPPTAPVCDECGVSKRETNHWWSLWREQHGILTTPMQDPNPQPGPRRSYDVKDACGEKCLLALISQWLPGIAE